MGNYSYLCKCCRKQILNPWNEETKAVAVLPWMIVAGTYNGYGSLITDNGTELGICPFRREESVQHASDEGQEPDVYHAECWAKSGFPILYRDGSDQDQYQGDHWDDSGWDEEDDQCT